MKARYFRPFEFAGWELYALRLLFAVLVYMTVDGALEGAASPELVGASADGETGADGRVSDGMWIRWVLGIALVFYVAGRWLSLALPVVCFVVIEAGLLLTADFETEPLPICIAGWVVVAQTIFYIWKAVSNRMRIDPASESTRLQSHRGAVWIAMQTTVASYLVCAVLKLFSAELSWLRSAQKFSVKVAEAGGDGGIVAESVSPLFIESLLFCQVVLVLGIALECTVAVALSGRLPALAYGVLLVAFHLATSLAIGGDVDLGSGCAFVFLANLPYWAGRGLRR